MSVSMKDLDLSLTLPSIMLFVWGVVFLILYLIHADRKRTHIKEVKLLMDIAEYHRKRKQRHPMQDMRDSVIEFLNLENSLGGSNLSKVAFEIDESHLSSTSMNITKSFNENLLNDKNETVRKEKKCCYRCLIF